MRCWIAEFKFCPEVLFYSGLRFFNELEIRVDLETRDPYFKVPPRGVVLRALINVLNKSIDLGRVWNHEPWISRRAHYRETTKAITTTIIMIIYLFAECQCFHIWLCLKFYFLSPFFPVDPFHVVNSLLSKFRCYFQRPRISRSFFFFHHSNF